MKAFQSSLLILVLPFVILGKGRCPECGLIVSGSVGYAVLSLEQVNKDHDRDVAEWNALGIDIPAFSPMHGFKVLSGSLTYRFGPYGAVSLRVVDFSKGIRTEYSDPLQSLLLERSVGAMETTVGFQYFIPFLVDLGDWYMELSLGQIKARARASAYGTSIANEDGEPLTTIWENTHSRYEKTKSFAAIGLGVNIPLFEPFLLMGKVEFQNAPVGKMEGRIAEFGERFREISTTAFDYTGLFFSLGIGIEF